MLSWIESIFDDYDEGRLDRRQALARLGAAVAALAAAGGGAAAAPGEAPTFASRGLNHIALRVREIERSRKFYERHLGLKTTSVTEWSCFMDCGGGNFVALFRGDEPGLDHYCFTVDDYRPGPVVERLKGAGLEPRRRENRVYFDDPDGIELQLAAKRTS